MSAARNLEGTMEPLEVRKEEFEKVAVLLRGTFKCVFFSSLTPLFPPSVSLSFVVCVTCNRPRSWLPDIL